MYNDVDDESKKILFAKITSCKQINIIVAM